MNCRKCGGDIKSIGNDIFQCVNCGAKFTKAKPAQSNPDSNISQSTLHKSEEPIARATVKAMMK